MALTTFVVFIPNASPIITTPIVLVGIILVPGFLLLKIFTIGSGDIFSDISYSIGLGLGSLLLGGLFINWLLPHLGIVHPLGALPLMIWFDFFIVILSISLYYFQKNIITSYRYDFPDIKNRIFAIIPWLFVVLSIFGAERLNNGGNGDVTIIMLVGMTIYLACILFQQKPLQTWTYVSALYSISLSLLLMYSLRSNYILGWDINLEYRVFQMTLQNLLWKPSYYPGLDYNACLSITILPTIFKELTNMPSAYIFKLTFQLLFATVPAMMFVFARRWLTNAWAFLATLLLVLQQWFYEQMPGLIRQETAFIFCMCGLITIFDDNLSKRTRLILFSIFTVGIIISHYSTAYVWLGIVFLALVIFYIARFFITSLRPQQMLITPIMFIASLVMIIIWQVPITNTIGSFTKFATNNYPIAAIPGATSTIQSTSATPIKYSTTPTDPLNIQAVNKLEITQYGVVAGYDAYNDTSSLTYIAQPATQTNDIPSKLPHALSAGIDFIAELIKLAAFAGLPIVGCAALYISVKRTGSKADYTFLLWNIVAYAMIVGMLLIPYVQIYYNLTRLYLQMLFTLSVVAVIGGLFIMKRINHYHMLILGGGMLILLCSSTGLLNQLTGGQSNVTLSNAPDAANNIYYIRDAEITGAQWLASNAAPMHPVQADIIANLRLESFTQINANYAIFPETIQRNGYVYLDTLNLEGNAFDQSDNNLLAYNYPLAFLNSHKNLIYNDGGSEIYR
jgi:uncharacterized membrane protein